MPLQSLQAAAASAVSLLPIRAHAYTEVGVARRRAQAARPTLPSIATSLPLLNHTLEGVRCPLGNSCLLKLSPYDRLMRSEVICGSRQGNSVPGTCARRGRHLATTKRMISVFHVNQPEACCSVSSANQYCGQTTSIMLQQYLSTTLEPDAAGAVVTLHSVEPYHQLLSTSVYGTGKWRLRNAWNEACVQRAVGGTNQK